MVSKLRDGGVGALRSSPAEVVQLTTDVVSAIAASQGKHYNGLAQALGDIRRSLPSPLARRLRDLHAASDVLRHFTA
eukprot:1636973-Prorocentrum_lima.AAC.1